ncbi:hypothetical protein [Krasilnikovia sp. M28-CT-15]|uniref:hypothetical protein n=1 Tax=Krasilnikovia sp. M28-CT-15 TaxID=3373540 RepID=UPI00387662F2
MLDPSTRPALSLLPLVHLLDAHNVAWVMTGSTVLALYGADIVPADLDVTPSLDSANLARLAEALRDADAIPAFTAGWRDDFTVETCRAWRPEPPTEEQLEWLYVTRHGMLDVPMRMCGTYDDLLPTATQVAIGGVMTTVCDPRRVLERVMRLTSPKHRARATLYQALGSSLGQAPAATERLLRAPR